MCRVQIINIGEQCRHDDEQLSWVKNFVSNLQKYYPNTRLNSFELIDNNKVVAFNADLYIYPISNEKIKVCFQTLENSNDLSVSNRPMHKVTITNYANPKADALSTFLLLLIGLTILPNGMGAYNSDLTDLITALQHGKRAQLVNQDFFNTKHQSNILSLLVWFNGKGKFSTNFYNLCAKVKNQLKSDDALAILNVTNHLVLKATTLAAVVTN